MFKIPMNGSDFMTVPEELAYENPFGETDQLECVFENGSVLVEERLDVIRKRTEVR